MFRYCFSIIILVGYSLSCTNPGKRDNPEEKALKVAEEIAFREYGNVIKNELPLKARLAGDTVWIVEGTLPEGALGGTVYIELSKGEYKLLKITHYK